jgi:hypothetical protein
MDMCIRSKILRGKSEGESVSENMQGMFHCTKYCTIFRRDNYLITLHCGKGVLIHVVAHHHGSTVTAHNIKMRCAEMKVKGVKTYIDMCMYVHAQITTGTTEPCTVFVLQMLTSNFLYQ